MMREPNELLRQARKRLPSHQVPGACLSRQEVADLVNQWIYDHTPEGVRVELDANYVGKLERGVIRWPTKLYRQAFRAVLRADSDAQLGFHGTRRRMATVEPVDRAQFLRVGGSVMALPWLDLFSPMQPTEVPAKVGRVEIDQVKALAATFMSWDNTYGGGLAREAVFAQLRWAAQLLHAEVSEPFRSDLFAAVAEFGGVAGFMAFDAYAHEDARHAFRFSLACAEQSGNWHLRASILSKLARQAIWCGRADDGLTHCELALVRGERLTATERASLHTLRARAHAKLHQVQETLSAVGAADDAFSQAKTADDPLWMAFYDHAQHQGDTGHALFDLSLQGRKTQAGQRLAYSVMHHGSGYARSRAISQTKLASLVMMTGDPRRAVSIGNAALDIAGGLRSRRALDDLRELHRFARCHLSIKDVQQLHDRITETLSRS